MKLTRISDVATLGFSYHILIFFILLWLSHIIARRDLKEMEKWGREMVRSCAGLPLAIVVLGGVLVTKPTFIEWQKVYYDSL